MRAERVGIGREIEFRVRLGAGGDMDALKAPVEKETALYEDTRVDIVVVGAGSAGGILE